MPKGKHHHNPKQAEFTDYTLASTEEGLLCSDMSRIIYEAEREIIANRRMERLDGRFWDTRQKPHPVQVRSGYPTKRDPDPERIRKKGQPFAYFTDCYKLVETLSGVFHVFQLHATRGWKRFA